MKLARLKLSGKLFVNLFVYGHHGYTVGENYLPDDANVVAVKYDPTMDIIDLTFHSEEFADVADGFEPPLMPSPIAYADKKKTK